MSFKILEKKSIKFKKKKNFYGFHRKGEAHLGGSFSMIETLVTLLKE